MEEKAKIKIKKTALTPHIFLLEFPTQLELASTFLRFQEHYESPKFRGEIFTLEEYKDWYTELHGEFSYYTDWSGFNIPSYVLEPFFEGEFDPLSEEEKQFLEIFKGEKEPFYIIGIFGELDEDRKRSLLKHEVAHGLFYTEPEYKKAVQEILSEYDLNELKNWMRSTGGYHEEVLEDETHAYSLTGSRKMTVTIPYGLKEKLETVFNKYYK
jgi:hypothetical protein